MTVTDYTDYNTHQAHADAISNTGVPLLARPGNLVNFTGTVAFSSTVTIASNVAVSKIGYEIFLSFFAPASNQSICTVQLIWSDSVSGLVVLTDQWDFYAGSGTSSNAHVIRGSGPTKGDTLTVKVSQNASTITASFTIVMAQNSRVYLRDDWRTVSSGPVTGIGGSVLVFTAGNVLSTIDSAAVAAGASVTSWLPLYAGRVVINCTTTSGTSDMQALILGDTGFGGSFVPDQVVRGKTDANGNLLIVGAVFPRSQCKLQQVNNNAAAKDLLTFITVAEY